MGTLPLLALKLNTTSCRRIRRASPVIAAPPEDAYGPGIGPRMKVADSRAESKSRARWGCGSPRRQGPTPVAPECRGRRAGSMRGATDSILDVTAVNDSSTRAVSWMLRTVSTTVTTVGCRCRPPGAHARPRSTAKPASIPVDAAIRVDRSSTSWTIRPATASTCVAVAKSMSALGAITTRTPPNWFSAEPSRPLVRRLLRAVADGFPRVGRQLRGRSRI